MKKLVTIFLIIFSVLKISAQAEPTKENVLKDAKSIRALGDINGTAVKKYTWEQVKLQFKEFANGDNLYDSKFRTEQSYEAKKNNLSYDDIGYIYVVATTPKDADGIFYDCSIQVTYYRSSQNGTWNFKESKMEQGGFYRRGTEKVNNQAVKEVIDILSTYKGEGDKNEVFKFAMDNFDFVKIEEIQKDPNQADYITSTQKYLYFLVKGTVASWANHTDYADLLYYYENALVQLTLRSEKGADGKWKLLAVEMPPRIENLGVGPEYNKGLKTIIVPESEKYGLIRFKTLRIHGFNEVYKKQGKFERKTYTQTDIEQFEKALRKLNETLFEDIEKGKTMLKEFIKPSLPNYNDVFNSWVSFYEKAKLYECELKFSTPSVKSKSGLKESVTTFEVYPSLSVNRKNAKDNKELSKKYKAAGMSKATLSATGGALYSENPNVYKIEYFNNRWYIIEGLSLDKKSWD